MQTPLWIVKLRRLPDRHGFLNGGPAPTIDRNSHHADTHHPQPGLLVCRRSLPRSFPALFDPVWWQTHRQVVGSSIGRGVTWFVKDESRHLVLRHYYRGGMVGKLVRDRFWFEGVESSRAMAEYRLLATLSEQGCRCRALCGPHGQAGALLSGRHPDRGAFAAPRIWWPCSSRGRSPVRCGTR